MPKTNLERRTWRNRIRCEGVQTLIPAVCLLSVLLPVPLTNGQNRDRDSNGGRIGARTVTHSEIGLIFAYPNGFSWSDVGAYVGTPFSGDFARMSADALRIQHGRFQFFAPADDSQFSFFPYSQLKQYDAEAVQAALQPLFITSTYNGKKRPVYFSWSLELHDKVPAASPGRWMQAVDVSSDEFIDFWINQYVKAVLWHRRNAIPTRWVGIDNCAFIWELYGVIDDSGRFVQGVPWDRPYPQNSDQYLTSIARFFHKLSQVAPEIRVMCNLGSLKDPSQFQRIYADVPGIMAEDILEADPREFARSGKYDLLTAVSWFGSLGRVAVLRAIVRRDAADDLRTAQMIYLLVKGPNFFFAPQFSDSTAAVPPSQYAELRSHLGEPRTSMRVECDPRAKARTYCLYSRTYERGLIYVNWTGRPQQIVLPHDRPYFDINGRPITILNVPDLSGTYATTEGPTHAARLTGEIRGADSSPSVRLRLQCDTERHR